MSGLIQHFDVITNTREQLVHAISIFLKWDKSYAHFQSGIDKNKIPYLTLSKFSRSDTHPLIAEMSSAEALADQISAWLKTCDWSNVEQYDTDGSNVSGWRITNRGPEIEGQYSQAYDVLTVAPAYIIYGK